MRKVDDDHDAITAHCSLILQARGLSENKQTFIGPREGERKGEGGREKGREAQREGRQLVVPKKYDN